MNTIVPKLEHDGEVFQEGKAKLVKQREKSTQMAAAKKVLGCSSARSITAVKSRTGKCIHLNQLET